MDGDNFLKSNKGTSHPLSATSAKPQLGRPTLRSKAFPAQTYEQEVGFSLGEGAGQAGDGQPQAKVHLRNAEGVVGGEVSWDSRQCWLSASSSPLFGNRAGMEGFLWDRCEGQHTHTGGRGVYNSSLSNRGAVFSGGLSGLRAERLLRPGRTFMCLPAGAALFRRAGEHKREQLQEEVQ